jgi:hypothetical protein
LNTRARVQRDRSRAAVASALTLAVLALLIVSFASIGRTSGYTLFRGDTGARAAASVAVDYRAVGDIAERIRIVLHTVRRGADPHPVPVLGSSAPHQMVPTGKDNAKSLALAGSAALFAAFGLIVLWWGRDRASFWLGIACAALAPELLTLYGFVPEPLMLACRLAADLLTFLAFYALYAMAEAVAQEALRIDDPVRRVLGIARTAVIVVLAVGASADAAALLLPVLRGATPPQPLVQAGSLATKVSWSIVFCLMPLVLLGIAALRAQTGEALKRSRLIFVTTLAGLSGIAFSIVQELAGGVTPHFETIWFTLLLIPIGFIAVIRAFGVIDVQIIINRILVLTVMTLIVGAAITLTEMLVHGTIEEWIKPKNEGEQQEFNAALQFVVGFVIVIIFGSLHEHLDEAIKKVLFRRRDRAIASLHAFAAHGAARFTERRALLDRTTQLVRDAMRTDGVAIYETSRGAFVLAASAGGRAWPARIGEDDPVFAVLRDEPEALSLDALCGPPSALGYDGCACRMGVGDRLIGALVVATRAPGADGAYDEAETEALTDVARGSGDVLFSLRVHELSAFLGELADGHVDGAGARARAAVLREGLATADAKQQSAPLRFEREQR